MMRKDFQKRRHIISRDRVDQAVADLAKEYDRRLLEKGPAIFASGHEIHGVIQEELDEFFDVVKQNGGREDKEAELLDIAVAALHAVVSLRSGEMDW